MNPDSLTPGYNLPKKPSSCASIFNKYSPGSELPTAINKNVFSAFIFSNSFHFIVILFANSPFSFQSNYSKFKGKVLALMNNPEEPETGMSEMVTSRPSISFS